MNSLVAIATISCRCCNCGVEWEIVATADDPAKAPVKCPRGCKTSVLIYAWTFEEVPKEGT